MAKATDEATVVKREQKRHDLKRTRLGLAFLIGAGSTGVLAIFTIMISCLASLLSLVGLGLIITGFIFLIKGRKALPKAHSRLVFLALVYFIVGIVLSIAMTLIVGGFPDTDRLIRMTDDEISGQDIIDTWKGEQEVLLPGAIAGSISALSWALMIFTPSKKWGRFVIVGYVGLAMILVITSLLWQGAIYQDHINDIEFNTQYSQTDYAEMTNDLLMARIPAIALSTVPNLLLIIVLVGAFMNIRKMEIQYQPKMDDKLKDLVL